MIDQTQEVQRFFRALTTLAEFVSDELSEGRQRGYWNLFHADCTIAEWEYACGTAMDRQAFHKVPLPTVLWEYIREYRTRRREQQAADARNQLPVQPQTPDDVGLAALRDILKTLEEKMELAKAQPRTPLTDEERERRIAEGTLNPPDPTRWLPMSEDLGELPKNATEVSIAGWHKIVPARAPKPE